MLLPAVVPDVPEARSDVVAARLARKLGPLFGVSWPGGQFPVTWVCDFTALTIAEIARGAPSPSRAEASAVNQDEIPPGAWELHGRAVVSRRAGAGRPDPLPYELAAATLNRFGPDTKAALVLTGTNALLAPVTDAIVQAWDVLHRHGDAAGLPLAQRITGWTALVLDAYRSQPALLLAAVTARAVQRLHHADVSVVLDDDLPTPARCELGADSGARRSPTSPVDLDLVDRTAAAVLSGSERTAPGAQRLAARIGEHWTRRVRTLAAPFGEAQWHLTERAAGQRRVEAFVPYEPLLTAFVDEVVGRDTGGPHPAAPVDLARSAWPLPTVPAADAVAGLPELTRRALVLACCAMVRTAFRSGSPEPFDDLRSLAVLEGLERLAEATLRRDDPVRLVARARVLDMRLEIIRQDVAHEASVAPTVTALVEALQTAFRRSRRGGFDPADAAELAFSANVELLAVCRVQATLPWPGVPAAEELSDTVAELWDSALRALGLDPAVVADDRHPGRPVDFHLHNYATFLGRRPDIADVRKAAALFDTVVLPSRRHHHELTGDFRPLLHSLQNATPATLRLAAEQRRSDQSIAGDPLPVRARGWIVEAMTSDYVCDLLARSAVDATDEACRFALLGLPALLAALEQDCSPDPLADRVRCEDLLDVAERFAARVAKTGGGYSRLAEITASRERLERVLLA